jgi:tetratricopeptide (TPR) repeat protein
VRNPWLAGLGAGIVALLLVYAASVSVLVVVAKNSEKRAIRGEAEANEQKEKAIAARNEATEQKNKIAKEAGVVRKQYEDAMKRMVELAGEIQDQVNRRLFTLKMGTEARGLRADLLNVVKNKILKMADDVRESETRENATPRSYQHLGDMLRRLGQGQEALKQYRLCLASLERIAEDQPDSDKALANLGMGQMRIADMDLELYGEARLARDLYARARKMRQQVADHPRSDEFPDWETKANLAHYDMALGKVELVLGNPQAARAHFQKAVEYRKVMVEHSPNKAFALNYLSESYMWLGIAAWHFRDARGCFESFAEAIRICEDLIRTYSQAFWFRGDLAEMLGHRGDAELRLGMADAAEKTYREALKNLQAELKRVPSDARYQNQIALLHDRFATLAARKGDLAGAKKESEVALNIRRELLGIDPTNRVWLAAAFRTSAQCGRASTAVRQLEKLYRERPKSIPILMETIRACAAGAAMTGDQATRTRYAERAAGALHAAEVAGYRDAVALKIDPDLAPLLKEPAFRAVVEKMEKR